MFKIYDYVLQISPFKEDKFRDVSELTLESIIGGGMGQSDNPSIFLAVNFRSLIDYQKLWQNCSLFVKTSFDSN